VFQRQSKYGEAGAMYRRTLEGRKKGLGMKIHNLDSVLEALGKCQEATAMHRRPPELGRMTK